MSLLLVLALLLPQDASAPQGPAPAPRWLPFDGVALTVNHDLLTVRGVTRDLVRWRRENPGATEAQLRATEAELVRERVKQFLRTQGGEDMGIAEEIVQRRVRDNMDRIQARQNGWVGMSKFLASRDMTTDELKTMLRSQMLGELWEDAVTGKGPAAGQRPVADRHVRPGRLKFLHREAQQSDDALAALGGAPERVRIQQIVLDPARLGGLQAARALADEIRAKLAAGVPFDELVAAHSAQPDNRGIGEYETLRIVRIEPALGEFLSGAKAGDTSAPVAGARGVLRIVRLLERVPRSVPEFGELATQKKMAERDQQAADLRRLGRAYEHRMAGSWVWPQEYRDGGRGD